ncbi:MAG: extracellular solute-binding protein [Eubacteriales bacterium]|nr:extracellular solute-binding protein [Eubacteriales bacterium]
MKKLVALCLALMLLAACTATCYAEEEITLRMAWWGSQSRAEKTQKILSLFSESHPGVSFEYEIYSNAGSHNEMMATQAAANELPDLFQGGAMTLEQWVKSGMLLDLTPYIESGALDLSNVPESIVDQGRIGDGVYCVTNGLNCYALAYNATVAKECGVEMKYDMTWDEFNTATRTIFEKTGLKINMDYGFVSDIIDLVARDRGYGLYDGNKLGVPDASIFEEVFQYYLDGVTEGWHVSPEIFVEITPGVVETDPLITGSCWCTVASSNQANALATLIDDQFELGMTSIPADNPIQSHKVDPAQAFMISANTKYPELCVEIINNITNSVEWNQILAADRGVPINGSIAEGIINSVSGASTLSIQLVKYVSQHSSPASPTYPKGAEEFSTQTNLLLEQVLYGVITPAEAAQQLFDAASKILSAN